MSNCYVFFGMHSLHSITACWLPDIATTSAASADIWSGHTRRSLYKANIHHTADRMRGRPPGDRKRGVGWGTSVSLSNSTTSDIARAGHQTCKGLTRQLRLLQPTLALLPWRPSNAPTGGAGPIGVSGAGPPQLSQPSCVDIDVLWGTKPVMNY